MPLNCKKCKDTGIITEWHHLLPFNPESHMQVKDLMRAFKVKVPIKRGTGGKETTDAKNLKRLGKKHPVFKSILDCRQRATLIGSYIWPLDENNTVRTTIGHHPSTWRKSSRKPNLQTIPKPITELNNLVRATVCAPEGYVFVEADSEGIEAVLVAYDVGDPLLMKVCKAGPHGFFMGATQGRPIDPHLPFDQLKKACKAEKKLDPALYDIHKRTIHGPLTPDHEVLTSCGWVPIAEYNGCPVAQWAEGGSVAFAPAELYSRDHHGVTVCLDGRSLSLCMTSDHGVPVFKNNKLRRIAAWGLPKTGRIPVVGNHIEGTKAENPYFIRLMVALQADGHVTEEGLVTFKFRKQRKITRLSGILKRLHLEYTTSHYEGDTVIRLSKQASLCVTSMLAPNKCFDLRRILSWTLECRHIFLDELPHWDGVRSGGRSGRSTAYLTCSKHNADVVQAVATLSNRQALLREKPPAIGSYRKQMMYSVSFNRRKQARLECMQQSCELYEGPVYCIANTMTGWVIVRRNGKVCVTGNTHYGLTPFGMHDEYQEQFATVGMATQYQQAYLNLWPPLAQWMTRTRQQAHEQRYLDNHFQYRHYFYNVMQWDSKRRIHVGGDDFKRCIAFKPQSDASAIQTEYVLAIMERAQQDPRYAMLLDWMRLLIHDSLLFLVPISEVSWVPQAVADVMNMPFKELGGLRIGVEVKVGPNLAEQSVVPIQQVEWEEQNVVASA